MDERIAMSVERNIGVVVGDSVCVSLHLRLLVPCHWRIVNDASIISREEEDHDH